ncbi:MAG: efflux RND transporter permease subunit [Candidatus Desulfacyla sp.]
MSHLAAQSRSESWLRYVVHHPGQVILLTALITLIFASHLPSLRFETSIYDLTIEDLPETLTYNRFKKAFGCEEIILVVARTTGVFNRETFGRIEHLAQSLSQIHGVKQVISLPGIKKAMDITDKWSLADFQEVVSAVGLFQKNLISEDGKTTAITLVLKDIDQKERVIDAVNTLIDAYQNAFTIYQVGMPIVSSALAQFTQHDFLTLPIATFSLIAVILFLFFRNLRGILIPSGTVLIALIWTFGLMAWTGTPLSLLTMIVPVFLIAVGTAYCMYIFPEYSASVEQSAAPREAAIQCFSRLWFPTALTVITTIIGLGSLLVNRVTEIRTFAVFSGFGILSLLILILAFLPAVMGLLPFPKRPMAAPSSQGKVINRILSTIIHLNLTHQKTSLALIALISLAGVIGISRIQVETNPVEFFKKDAPVARHFHDIYQDMSGSFPVSVVVASREDGYFEDPQNLKKISKVQDFLNTLPGVDKTISLVDYLRLINYASNQCNPDFYVLPEAPFEIRMLVNSFKNLLGLDMLSRFISHEFSRTHIMMRTHISSSNDFLSTEAAIRDYLNRNFPDNMSVEVTGFGIVISHSSRLISEGQVKSLGLTLVLVFAIMFILFMSYKVGVIALLPNCFPIIVTFGVMGWFGIPLSMATSLIAGIAIGLAVDDTIHYLVNYNREFKKDLNKRTSLVKTIRHTGRPIIFTTITISLGFSVLMFSSFKPTSMFGLLMMITMFSALVADVVLLPSLMLHVELVTIWDLLKFKLGKDPQKGIPLFDGLSRTQIHHVLMAGSIKDFRAGETVFRKGDKGDIMYVIVSGELVVNDSPVSASHETKGRFNQIIATLQTGDVVGEMGLIRSCERSATVVASKPTELLQINERMIKRLQRLHGHTAHKFFFNLMKVLCDRLENTTRAFLNQSITDRLTGLYTRDYFITILNREVALTRSIKEEMPLCLIIISLDDLPMITLRDGYEMTDAILQKIARLLVEKVGGAHHCSRFNANQFACMLVRTSPRDALALCEDIWNEMEHSHPESPGETAHVRLNFGLAFTKQDGGDDVHSLINAAFHWLDRERWYENGDKVVPPIKLG